MNNNAILFQPTGEVREADGNDFYLDGGEICRGPSYYEHPIFTRHEISAEVAKKMMEVKDGKKGM